MKNSRNKKFASFKQHYTALELFCFVIIVTNLLLWLIYRLNPIIGVCAGICIVYWVEGQSAAAAGTRLGVRVSTYCTDSGVRALPPPHSDSYVYLSVFPNGQAVAKGRCGVSPLHPRTRVLMPHTSGWSSHTPPREVNSKPSHTGSVAMSESRDQGGSQLFLYLYSGPQTHQSQSHVSPPDPGRSPLTGTGQPSTLVLPALPPSVCLQNEFSACLFRPEPASVWGRLLSQGKGVRQRCG